MDVEEAQKKFPQIYGRDFGERITLDQVLDRLCAALDANASKESIDDVACDILDRDFLFGAWGSRWNKYDELMLRDIRGIIIAAYRRGKAKATA